MICERVAILGFKVSIAKFIYKLGPGMRLARRIGGLDEFDCPRVEFLLALAETLDDLETRHFQN